MKYRYPALCLFAASFFISHVQAQVNVSVNVNVDAQPNWGPSGYDNVNYYYMPDIETYYYVPKHQFIYFNGGNWVFATSLPPRCSSYNLYRGYKVVINDPRPYLHHENYRVRYAHYREYYDHQPVLRDHRDDGPGNGHGKGHAYGHYKEDKHDKKDHGHGDHDD
ncbi:MAG TPA: hypothetical protein VFI33_16755 [Puia sp.]|nr:hypothetical protein [Puia sp.]